MKEQFSDAKNRLLPRITAEKGLILSKTTSNTELVTVGKVKKLKVIRGVVAAFVERLRELEVLHQELDFSELILLIDLVLAIPLSNAGIV